MTMDGRKPQKNISKNKKPTILLVHNYYQLAGGEDSVVASEKKLLEENGHKVILYSRSNLEIHAMNIFQKLILPFTTMFSFKTYWAIRKLIQMESIDIIHVHNTLSLISPSVFYAAFSSNIPIVQTLHNFRMQCPNGLFFKNGQACEDCLKKGLWRSLKHKCYRNSRVQTLVSAVTIKIHRILGTYHKVSFICLTEYNRNKLLELNTSRGKEVVDEEKVFVKPNFTEIDMEPVPCQRRENQCVFAGRLEEIKGIYTLLQAWKEIKDIRLILCGSGPLDAWCREYVEENQLDNVIIKGFVDHQELMEIIRRSKALILPSIVYEGFPMTMVESMACGTPVIGSDFGNIGSLIMEGKNGLKFKKGSAEDLRSKVYLLQDMVETCRQIYQEKYAKDENYKLLLNIYKKAGEMK